MFQIGLDEMMIVVVPVSGQPIYRLLPDSAEVRTICACHTPDTSDPRS